MKKAIHKAEKGVIEVAIELDDEKIQEIIITGDFFVYPEEAIEDLEQALVGCPLNKQALAIRLEEAYSQLCLETPGVNVTDWVTVILNACKE